MFLIWKANDIYIRWYFKENHFAILREYDVIEALSEMEKEGADFKILNFHWGNEYVHIPSITQRRMAYKFIEAGASIIAGHHPHVIQPYEKYQEGHIFYSLGNFIFDYIQSKKISIGLHVVIEITDRIISNVKFFGVDLSYKDLVKKSNNEVFKSFFAKINKIYKELLLVNDFKYESIYSEKLAQNHLVERIYMKTSLLKEFFKIDREAKYHLIKNILTHYLK